MLIAFESFNTSNFWLPKAETRVILTMEVVSMEYGKLEILCLIMAVTLESRKSHHVD